MDTSILSSTKKILGLDPDDESFDLDVITHINSAFSILSDIGIGPHGGYGITDASDTWEDLGIESKEIVNLIKTCLYLRVRLLFDPPQTPYLQAAFQKQIEEHEWRLNQMRENVAWVNPNPPLTGEAV
jgi:hypothetical protein